MKKICVFLLMALLLTSGLICAQASAPHLVDAAQLLSEQEASRVQNELDNTSAALGMDVVVVTVNSLGGMTASTFAGHYYDSRDYSSDGILLVISMEEREWSITTTGSAMDKVTDSECAEIGSRILSELSGGDYAGAFLRFAELVESYAQNGAGFDMGWLVCIGIGVLTGLITVLVMKSQLKSVRPRGTASDYVVRGSFALTQSNELYLFSNVSRVQRSQDNGSHRSSSGSGRSHGGASGRF